MSSSVSHLRLTVWTGGFMHSKHYGYFGLGLFYVWVLLQLFIIYNNFYILKVRGKDQSWWFRCFSSWWGREEDCGLGIYIVCTIRCVFTQIGHSTNNSSNKPLKIIIYVLTIFLSCFFFFVGQAPTAWPMVRLPDKRHLNIFYMNLLM